MASVAQSQAEREADDLMDSFGGVGTAADQQRADILKMLDRREKDTEELELESVFSELRSRAGGEGKDEEIDEIAN